MTNNPRRLEAIKRYREQVLDRAAMIAALALVRVDEYELGELADRQDAQLAELLHDFAFRLRKLAELASREQFASVSVAKKKTVVSFPDTDDVASLELLTMSLWEVCGRIIHSDLFDIRRSQLPEKDGELTGGRAAWGFSVGSDFDKEHPNFVFVEFLLKELLAFDTALDRDIRSHELNIGQRPEERAAGRAI